MYVRFVEYFSTDDVSHSNDILPHRRIQKLIADHLSHQANSEFSDELYSRAPLDFNVIRTDLAEVTVWLRQSGRDTMANALSDLVTCLDAGDCIDWSKIPRDCGGTLDV